MNHSLSYMGKYPFKSTHPIQFYSPVLTIEVLLIFPMLPHSWDPQVFGINRKRMASLPTVFSIAKKSVEWQNVILGRTKHFKYMWWQECYFCLPKKLSSKPPLCERKHACKGYSKDGPLNSSLNRQESETWDDLAWRALLEGKGSEL